MGSEGEKPGFIRGISNEFTYDVPYNPNLTTGDQQSRALTKGNELMRVQTGALRDLRDEERRTQDVTRRVADETQRTRETTERAMVPLLRDVALSNRDVGLHLDSLGNALAQGMQEAAKKISKTVSKTGAKIVASVQDLEDTTIEVGESIVGIPTDKQTAKELIESRAVDETEMIVLAARGALNEKQRLAVLMSLPDWKSRFIYRDSNLVINPDPEREKTFRPEVKMFLAELRRKSITPTLQFPSLGILARHGVLEREFHNTLAKTVREVRFGTEGTNYGMRELNYQADALIAQGGQNLRDNQVAISQRGQGLRDNQVAISQRQIGIRLMEAGVLQGEQLVELGRESLGVQRSQLGVQTESLGVQRSQLGVQAESLGVQRSQLGVQTESLGVQRFQLGVQTESAMRLGDIQMLAERAEVDRGAMRQGLDNLNQAALEAHQNRLQQIELTGDLVDIGGRHTALLTDIRGGIGVLNEYASHQLMQLTQVNRGIEVLQEIGIAHLEISRQTRRAIGHLEDVLVKQTSAIVNVIEAVRSSLLDMEKRTVARDSNRDRIGADESFRNAMEMLKIGEVDDAIEFFTKSRNRYPADFRVYLQRGLCYVQNERVVDAEKDFKKALKTASGEKQERTRAVIRLNLARLYYSESKVVCNKEGDSSARQEKLLQAIEEAKKAIDEDPDFLEAHFALATYLAAFKLWEESLRILMQIIPQDPKFAKRMDDFDIFTPLRGSLKNTLSGNTNEDSMTEVEASLSIARDEMGINETESALERIEILVRDEPVYLNEAGFWDMKEFKPVIAQIRKVVEVEIKAGRKKSCEQWYAIASIALHAGVASMDSLYTAFQHGAKVDPSFKKRNTKEIRSKLGRITGKKYQQLVSYIKRIYPPDYPWLINNL